MASMHQRTHTKRMHIFIFCQTVLVKVRSHNRWLLPGKPKVGQVLSLGLPFTPPDRVAQLTATVRQYGSSLNQLERFIF